jgi:hypothetical protein
MGRKMTRLECFAQHGSTSYGEISPDRLREILLGDDPQDGEEARVRQALLETPATGLHSNPAEELAEELCLTLAQLDDRCVELTSQTLGSSCPSLVAQLVEVGLAARYKNDLDSLQRARQAIRKELLARGWVLSPHTDESDFQRHTSPESHKAG